MDLREYFVNAIVDAQQREHRSYTYFDNEVDGSNEQWLLDQIRIGRGEARGAAQALWTTAEQIGFPLDVIAKPVAERFLKWRTEYDAEQARLKSATLADLVD